MNELDELNDELDEHPKPINERPSSPYCELNDPPEPEAKKKTPKHLCFIVHGQGGFIQKRFEQLMQNYSDVLKEDFTESVEVEFVPIVWQQILANPFEVMANISLPTLGVLRRLTNETLSDVLYYFTKFHGQSIVDVTTQQFNVEYAKFMEKYPDFDGRIGIYGHSLGGIISYDIIFNQKKDKKELKNFNDLVYPKLDFKPNFLFSLGSPVAAVMIMRGIKIEDYELPIWCTYFNIFHLYDPLGYRIEPLLDPNYATVPPVPLIRPSSSRPMTFLPSFYSNLVSEYVSSFGIPFPSWPSLPPYSDIQFPNIPNIFPNIPNIPIPNLGLFENLPVLDFTSTIEVLNNSFDGVRGFLHGKRKRADDEDEKEDDVYDYNGLEESWLFDQTKNKEKIDGVDVDVVQPPHKKRKRTKPTSSTETTNAEQPPEKRKSMSPSHDVVNIVTHIANQASEILKRPVDVFKRMSSSRQSISDESKPSTEKKETEEVKVETEKEKLKVEPLLRRYDFFVQETVIDSLVHQYFVGIRSHFIYWGHKDVMYAVLKCFQDGPEFMTKPSSPLS